MVVCEGNGGGYGTPSMYSAVNTSFASQQHSIGVNAAYFGMHNYNSATGYGENSTSTCGATFVPDVFDMATTTTTTTTTTTMMTDATPNVEERTWTRAQQFRNEHCEQMMIEAVYGNRRQRASRARLHDISATPPSSPINGRPSSYRSPPPRASLTDVFPPPSPVFVDRHYGNPCTAIVAVRQEELPLEVPRMGDGFSTAHRGEKRSGAAYTEENYGEKARNNSQAYGTMDVGNMDVVPMCGIYGQAEARKGFLPPLKRARLV